MTDATPDATPTPPPIIEPADVLLFAPDLGEAKAEAMIADALAWAVLYAPCLADPAFDQRDAAKAIIRRAILRMKDTGSGAMQSAQRTAGPYAEINTLDTRVRAGDSVFTEQEIADLRRLCGVTQTAAFSILPRGDHDPVSEFRNDYRSPIWWP